MMKKIVLLFVFTLALFSNESNSTVETKEKSTLIKDERLCGIFQEKALSYKKQMRGDPLAAATLDSYIKRANIFCSKPSQEELEAKLKKEDDRLCKQFTDKENMFKKDMRNDEIAHTILQTHQFQTKAFCDNSPLKNRFLSAKEENKRLCQESKTRVIQFKKIMDNDELSKQTLQSYNNKADIFCATKMKLKEKDQKAHNEEIRLCKIFKDKINLYVKTMRQDALAEATLDSYAKRANHFCQNVTDEELKEAAKQK